MNNLDPSIKKGPWTEQVRAAAAPRHPPTLSVLTARLLRVALLPPLGGVHTARGTREAGQQVGRDRQAVAGSHRQHHQEPLEQHGAAADA